MTLDGFSAETDLEGRHWLVSFRRTDFGTRCFLYTLHGIPAKEGKVRFASPGLPAVSWETRGEIVPDAVTMWVAETAFARVARKK